MNKSNISSSDDYHKAMSFLETTHCCDTLLGYMEYVFEPILNEKGEIVMSEMLSRFRGIAIHEGLKILKDFNRTYDLFELNLNKAFYLASIHNQHICVNAFLPDISDPKLFEDISILEQDYKIDSGSIIIEVLEYDYGNMTDVFFQNLSQLQAKGFKISIDDFIPETNSGDNISCEILKKLRNFGIVPDYVKIDGQYLQDLFGPKSPNTAINSLKLNINFLRLQGVTIIGEWIRNEEDGLNAKKLGIQLFQGRELSVGDFCLEVKSSVDNLVFNDNIYER